MASLAALGAEIDVVSRSLDPLALAWLERSTLSRARVRRLDARCLDESDESLQSAEIVFNLAGEPGAARSMHDPRSDAQSSVGAHLAVLEALRGRKQPPRVVFLSSRLVYGPTGTLPVNEERTPRPSSVYGVHKLAVEHYHRLYWEHFGIPFTILRLTNPHGPLQLPDRREYGAVNRFVLAALRGETIALYGGGGQLRDSFHIADAVSAIIAAASDDRALAQTINIGAGYSTSVRSLVESIVALAGSGTIVDSPWTLEQARVETGDFGTEFVDQLGWRHLHVKHYPRIQVDHRSLVFKRYDIFRDLE